MSLSDFDRESIRVDIDAAISSPDAAQAFLRKWGAEIRELAIDPQLGEFEAARDEAFADATKAEASANAYSDAMERLISDIDAVCEDLDGGKIYDKLLEATGRASDAVKDL